MFWIGVSTTNASPFNKTEWLKSKWTPSKWIGIMVLEGRLLQSWNTELKKWSWRGNSEIPRKYTAENNFIINSQTQIEQKECINGLCWSSRGAFLSSPCLIIHGYRCSWEQWWHVKAFGKALVFLWSLIEVFNSQRLHFCTGLSSNCGNWNLLSTIWMCWHNILD